MRLSVHGAAVLIAIAPSLAGADVLDSSDAGFTLANEAMVAATPERLYASLLQIGSWWDSEHSYSGDSHNMSLEGRAGGCFCEKLPNQGSVQHMTVMFAAPGKLLRMSGGLGPLQGLGVAGSMEWKLSAVEGGTRLELRYVVGGYRSGGLREMAAPVDGVLRAQLLRLKNLVETGQPAAK